MPHRIMFGIQKGGVGKTTSTVSAAEVLASAGYKVLVIDFESQGNATKMLTQNSIYRYAGRTIMEAIQAGNAAPYIMPVKENLDLIPAEDRLSTFSRYIYTSRMDNPYAALERLLRPVEDAYDFVFVDVGPTLGDTMINAIVYVDHIIVPMDLGDFALDAMVRYIEFVSQTRAEGHTKANVLGILLTMRDGRSKYERKISEGVRAAYGDLVFPEDIGRRTKIKEASATGIDVLGPVMEDYAAMAEELLKRLQEV